MRKRPYHFLLPALILFPASAPAPAPAPDSRMGGWATITLDQVPDQAVAGRPLNLSFVIRQHGVTPMKGLKPVIEAHSGALKARVAATPGRETGQYAASVTFPQAGEWNITIHSGFGESKLTLLPLKVVEAGAASPAALGVADQGRRLFVGKGCVGCHVRAEANLADGESIGPSLTGKRWEAAWLTRFLADPSIPDRPRSGTFVMPNLGLTQSEISALVAFLNAERRSGEQ